MQYALKIDTPKVKKDPRLATVRNEAEVSHTLTTRMPTSLLAPVTKTVPSAVTTRILEIDPHLFSHEQKLKRLQSCDGVPRLVEGGLGKHHGRSYVVMELFADNLAVFQQKTLLDAAAIRSIGLQHLSASLIMPPAP
jgi:hypothetical protein